MRELVVPCVASSGHRLLRSTRLSVTSSGTCICTDSLLWAPAAPRWVRAAQLRLHGALAWHRVVRGASAFTVSWGGFQLGLRSFTASAGLSTLFSSVRSVPLAALVVSLSMLVWRLGLGPHAPRDLGWMQAGLICHLGTSGHPSGSGMGHLGHPGLRTA